MVVQRTIRWCLLIASPVQRPLRWETYQPIAWTTTTAEDAGQAPITTQYMPSGGAPNHDWWVSRKAIRERIVQRCARVDEVALTLFNDLLLVSVELAQQVLHECRLEGKHLCRYFQCIPHDPDNVILRTDPPPLTHASKPQRDLPQTLPSATCPRGELLRRLCVEQGLVATQDTVIQSFKNTGCLLLPFGRPVWDTMREALLLPPALRRTGCSGGRFPKRSSGCASAFASAAMRRLPGTMCVCGT